VELCLSFTKEGITLYSPGLGLHPPIFVYHRARAVRGRSCCVAAKRRVGSLAGACMDSGRYHLCIGK